MPGLIGADGAPIRVVNLPWLEGRPLRGDLNGALRVPVAIANDANCLALSEAVDGAAAGARVVFGAILGTGVGGGIVVEGKAAGRRQRDRRRMGPQSAAGDAPGGWPAGQPAAAAGRAASRPGSTGAALARDYRNVSGGERSAAEVARLAEAGEPAARTALARYQRRLAAALAGMINLLDPDVIVLGGGLSSIASLYAEVPEVVGAADRRRGAADPARACAVRPRKRPARRRLARPAGPSEIAPGGLCEFSPLTAAPGAA